MKLAVVCPVFNEDSNIERVVQEWITCLNKVVGIDHYQFIIFNDGSTDKTAEKVDSLIKQYPTVSLINKANTGHGPTCVFAYHFVIDKNQFEWVFQIDSDGQCDPVYFEKFWKNKEHNNWQWGQRITRDDGWQRIVVTKILSLFVFLGSGVYVKDSNVPYRLMPVLKLKSIIDFVPKDFFLANVLLSVLAEAKFKISWHTIHFRARFSGESKVRGFKFAKIGFKLLQDLYHMRSNFK